MRPQYGEPGNPSDNDVVPLHELIQCQIELECWRSQRTPELQAAWQVIWLACDFGGTDVRLYRITRDPALVKTLLKRGATDWKIYFGAGDRGRIVCPSDDAWHAWVRGGAAGEDKVKRTGGSRVRLSAQDLLNAPIPKVEV